MPCKVYFLEDIGISWLNVAKIELSVPQSQCLDGRITDIGMMRKEEAAWESERNNHTERTAGNSERHRHRSSLPLAKTRASSKPEAQKKARCLVSKAPGIILATTYSRTTYRSTTIGSAAFHFRVRDGNGWVHCAGSPDFAELRFKYEQ